VSDSTEQGDEGYWERVQDIGEIRLGEATTVKFQRGITRRDKREVLSMRTWVSSARYSGPTKQGFNLDLKTAEEFYDLLGRALGKT
jgi:hypothetical protein